MDPNTVAKEKDKKIAGLVWICLCAMYSLLPVPISIGRGCAKDVTPETLGIFLKTLHVMSIAWLLLYTVLFVLLVIAKAPPKFLRLFSSFCSPGFYILVGFWLYNWYSMKTKIKGTIF